MNTMTYTDYEIHSGIVPLFSLVRDVMNLYHLLWTFGSPKGGIQYQKNLPYLTEILWDISDLPFVQNKGYQCQVSHLDILK